MAWDGVHLWAKNINLLGNIAPEAVAQRILVSVEMCAIAHPASKVLPVLTVSLGVAVFDGAACDAPTEPNMDKLYALADAALYQAKTTGRNRAVIASEKVSC